MRCGDARLQRRCFTDFAQRPSRAGRDHIGQAAALTVQAITLVATAICLLLSAVLALLIAVAGAATPDFNAPAMVDRVLSELEGPQASPPG